HYAWGAFILIANLFVTDFMMVVNTTKPYGFVGNVHYVIMCILLGSLFLPLWGTIVMYIVALVGIQMLPMFSVPAIIDYPGSLPAAFNGVLLTGILIIVAAAMRQQDLKQIQQQGRELLETMLDVARRKQAEETMQQAHAELEVRVEERTSELSTANELLRQEIVERVRAEEALQQAKREAENAQGAAEAANQAKSQFLARMSHELRTPLNGILGYAQILKRDSSANQYQLEGLDIVEQSGRHLLTLINDILDLAKVESGKVDLHETNFDLLSFLRSISEMIRIRTEEKGLYLRTEFAPGEDERLPVSVRGDERRLRQVLVNLLGNATKFTDEGGVTFKIEKIESSDKAGSKEAESSPSPAPYSVLRFTIADTGIGMSPEELSVVFEPFRQVGDQQRQRQGTGLGLAISRNLLELMGSELQLRSDLGKGTVFWFDLALPEVIGWDELEDERQIVGIEEKAPKVLVVDDNWQNRAVLVGLLSPLGFEMLEASNGREGLLRASEFRPDVVITDLVMPEMDGIELIRQLRQSPASKDVVIIAVSASAYENDQQTSLEAGGNAFVRKPVEANDLFEQLQRHLGLKWVYADSGLQDSAPLPADADRAALMSPPPADELATLFELLVLGDVRGILDRTDELERADERLGPFAIELRRLAKGFQIERIREMLESYSPQIKEGG
ncbi:MAG: response regulator, partial [bacterium]|nr:response regulator [bacterium]